MNVENTRRLAVKKSYEWKGAKEKVGGLERRVEEGRREVGRKERRYEEKKEELSKRGAVALSAYFQDMEEDDESRFNELTALAQQLAVLDLEEEDFPIKLCFLDKSASMSFSETSLKALEVCFNKSSDISEGTCLVVMLAGVGESQYFLHRPRFEGPQLNFESIQLGCSTWFNEPIYLILSALATQLTSVFGRDSSSFEEPPISVICVTDGMDNCSVRELQDIRALSSAIGGIVDGEGGRVFRPLGSWTRRDRERMADPDDGSNALIPVWLVWCAIGSGSCNLLKQASREVAVVDCTYEIDAAACSTMSDGASENGDPGKIEVGSLVAVKGEKGGGEWVVTREYADAVQEEKKVFFDLQNLSGSKSRKDVPKERVEHAAVGDSGQQAKPRPSKHLAALALVNETLGNTGSVMKQVNAKGIVPLSTGINFITDEFTALISEEPDPKFKVKSIDYFPVEDKFVENFLAKLGKVAWKMCGDEELAPCKKLITAVVKSLLREEDVHWAVLSDLCNGGEETRRAALVGAAAKLGIVLGDGLESTEKLRRLSSALDSVLQFFFKTGLIRRNWSHGYQLVEHHRPSLMAALNVMKGPSDCVMKLGKANYLSRRRNSLPVLQGAVRGEERKLARRATIMSMKKDQEWKWCLNPLEVAEEKQIVSVRKLSGSSTASTSTVGSCLGPVR